MKKLFFLFLICLFAFSNIYSQNETGESKTGGISMGKTDRVLINYFTDIWQSNDTNSSISVYSPGFDIYGMYNIPFGKSKFSLGFGIGFGTHNMRSDAMPVNEVKFDSVYTGNTVFKKIPEKVNNNDINYNVNKLALTYFDIPLELRFKTENKKGKAIKFAVGFKGGYLINSHTKYSGTKFSPATDADAGTADIKVKTYKIKNLELLRYGTTVRFGYGIYNIFAYYSLSKIFIVDKGPEMYPISVGICITPF